MKLYDSESNIVYWDNLLKISEFKALSETPQNVLWHKEGDAFKHTCMVTQCMLNHINLGEDRLCKDSDYREILVYSALLHDIGKTVTTVKGEDGLYHCPNHAIKGVSIASNILIKYVPKIEYYVKVVILNLIRYHMQPLYILNQKSPKVAILKLANNLEYIGMEALLLLKKCDCEGSIPEKYDNSLETLEEVRKLYYDVCSYPKGTYVTIEKIGDMCTCSYTPGNHPNGINIGYKVDGILQHPVTKGLRTSLGFRFSTSPVTKIVDKNHFQTKNSEYKIIEQVDKKQY